MTFRKNGISIFLWAFYAFTICMFYLWVMFEFLQNSPIKNMYLQAGIVCFGFLLMAGLFLLCRLFYKRTAVHKEMRKQTFSAILWEAFLAVLFLGTGLFLRIYFMANGGEEAAYFETARVTGEGLIPLAHGAQFIYVVLLRGFFYLIGNYYSAGILLQIFLQIILAIIWYFAAKRIWGRMVSMILLAGIMLFPFSITESIYYSPKMLYLILYGLVFLMIGRFLTNHHKNISLKWYSWLHTIIMGMGIGILTYLDITGLTLLIPVIFLCLVKRAEGDNRSSGKVAGQVFLQLLLAVAGCFLTVFVFMYVDAKLCGSTVDKIFLTYCTLFAPKGQVDVLELFLALTSIEKYLLLLIVFMFLFGIPAFFTKKKEEIQMLSFLWMLGISVIYAGNFNARGMNSEYLLFMSVLLLLGTGIQAMFLGDGIKQEKTEMSLVNTEMMKEAEINKAAISEAVVSKAVVSKAVVSNSVINKAEINKKIKEEREPKVETEIKQTIKYIENPLPLPKKHVKKKMDYHREVTSDQMHYDIEVSEADDYDL